MACQVSLDYIVEWWFVLWLDLKFGCIKNKGFCENKGFIVGK